MHKTSDGDKYIDLGKKKRATVRSFKGMPLLDIREFYGQEGDEKPGKKGISLSLEQVRPSSSGYFVPSCSIFTVEHTQEGRGHH